MDGSTLLLAIAFAAVGYSFGSVPVGVLVARATGGTDPRTIGSGRTGTTNALRAMGPRGAAVVVLGDLLKGIVPVLLARLVTRGDSLVEVVTATAALIGSCRSLFLGFGGGRGVVTLGGTMLVILPVTVIAQVAVLVVTVAISRYMSLGSLLGSAAILPATLVVSAMTPGGLPLPVIVYAVLGPAIVWIAHADNIDRLRHGTERRFDFALLRGKGAGEG